MLLHSVILLIFLPEIDSRRGGGSRGSSRTSSRGSSSYKPSSYKPSSYKPSTGYNSGSSIPKAGQSFNSKTSSYPKQNYGGSSNYNKNSYGSNNYGGGSWNSRNTYKGPTSYPGGSSSWSKSSPIVSSSSLKSYKNPNYGGLQMAAKKKSMFSKVKTPLMVAGGAYLGYKLGKGIGQLSMLSNPMALMTPTYGGYGYGPYYNYGGYHHSYHYESPHMYREYAYNKYPDMKTDSCYECSSIGGSNPVCDNMDDSYPASSTDAYRAKCPQEGSVCVVTVGRVFPIVDEAMPAIDPNNTDPNSLKKWEGKSFTRRACVPPNRQNVCNAYCPTPIANSDVKYNNECDIYMCNMCDTESCNSWGLLSMPDKRNVESGRDSQAAIQSTLPLLLILLAAFFN